MFLTFIKILLLFINAVRSSDISDDAYKQIRHADRFERGFYKYSHLPEESIPVAIVIDDNDGREGKSIDVKVSNFNKNIVHEKKPSDHKNATLLTLSGDFIVKSAEVNTTRVNLSETKTNMKENLQIPVAVIYEVEPTTIKNYKKVLRRIKNRNQGPSNQPNPHRLQKVELNASDNKHIKENVTEKDNAITTTTEKLNQAKEIKQAVIGENLKAHKTRERDPVVPIIQSENKVYGHNGNFEYSYEGGDGTKAFEKGELKSFEDDKTGEAVVGGFSYTDKDGQDFSLSYTADENGYRPVGAHLPTPPPIPPAIERALRYLATKTTPEPVTDPITDSKDDSE